ncbi:hypothetical protein JTB14_019542 [Gonioctena quinquepunctata]|nr:hypothetical protein JTB14_019542 [Gonioctena quinquepunctata]
MEPRFERGFSLKDALDMAYNDDADVSDIFIEPPDYGVLSDEDPRDENGGGLIDNLPGSQLRAPELELSDGNRIGGYCEVQCMEWWLHRRMQCQEICQGEPIRFRYRIWCPNTPSGYVVDFKMCQDNYPCRCEENGKIFEKSAAPSVVMLDELVNVGKL